MASAAALICELHGDSLRKLSDALPGDYDGLTTASRAARRAGRISPGLARKLERLDWAFAWSRHITATKSNLFAARVDCELAAGGGRPAHAPVKPAVRTVDVGVVTSAPWRCSRAVGPDPEPLPFDPFYDEGLDYDPALDVAPDLGNQGALAHTGLCENADSDVQGGSDAPVVDPLTVCDPWAAGPMVAGTPSVEVDRCPSCSGWKAVDACQCRRCLFGDGEDPVAHTWATASSASSSSRARRGSGYKSWSSSSWWY